MRNITGKRLLNLFLTVLLIVSSFLPVAQASANESDAILNVSTSSPTYTIGDLLKIKVKVTHEDGSLFPYSKPSIQVLNKEGDSVHQYQWRQDDLKEDGTFREQVKLTNDDYIVGEIYQVVLKAAGKTETTSFEVVEKDTFSLTIKEERYSQGDMVEFSGVVLEDGLPVVEADIPLSLLNPEGDSIDNDQISTNEKGVFQGDFRLPNDLNPGTYSVEGKAVKLGKYSSDTFEVIKSEEKIPVISLLTPSNGDIYNSNTVKYRGEAEAGSSILIRIMSEGDIVQYENVRALDPGAFSGELKLSEGNYTLTAKYQNYPEVSGTVSFSVDVTPPAKPNVSLDLNGDDVKVSWNEDSDVSSYDVLVSTDKDDFATVASSINNNSIIYEDVEPNTEYSFKVKAYDKVGNSSVSDIASITVPNEEDENEEEEEQPGNDNNPPVTPVNPGNSGGNDNNAPSNNKKVKKKVSLSESNKKIQVKLTEDEREDAKKNGLILDSEELEIDIPAEAFQNEEINEVSVEKKATLSDVEEFQGVEDQPIWASTVENVISLTGSNEESSFTVPVKLTFKGQRSSSYKKVAKFKKTEEGLFAITRPTKWGNGQYESLTPRFSVYGLISAPKKVSGVVNDVKDGKSVSLDVNGKADIYYTTDSSLVEHIYSQEEELTSYSIRRDNINFNEWNKYKETFTVGNDETVFALAVNKNVIGLVSKVTSPEVKDWDVMSDVDKDKEFTIGFDTKLNKSTVNSNYIYITDEEGERFDASVSLSEDGQSVTLSPEKVYSLNESYTLHISQDVESEYGKFLKEEVEMKFSR